MARLVATQWPSLKVRLGPGSTLTPLHSYAALVAVTVLLTKAGLLLLSLLILEPGVGRTEGAMGLITWDCKF